MKTNLETIFSYTGQYQEFIAPYDGTYKIELWGASGGDATLTMNYNGKGGYVSGNIYLKKDTKLYVYIGQQGIVENSVFESNTTKYTFNGGGYGNFYCTNYYGGLGYNHTGGGATDIRLTSGNWDDFHSLKSRIMVAAAGGGGYLEAIGGSGGGLNGYNGVKSSNSLTNGDYYGYGASQINGGNTFGTFGKGGNATFNETCNVSEGFGGGSGYYGGGGTRGSTMFTAASGAGGSSYISGHEGCNAISQDSTEFNIKHTGNSQHYSGYTFTNTKMIDGNGYQWTTSKQGYTGMPTHDGKSTMIGNNGDGYAKITLIS